VGSKIQDSIEKRRTQSPSSLATANRVEREEDRDRPAVTAALEQAYSCISVGRLGHGQIELCEDLGQIELCEDLGLSHSGLAHSWRHAQSDHVYHFSLLRVCGSLYPSRDSRLDCYNQSATSGRRPNQANRILASIRLRVELKAILAQIGTGDRQKQRPRGCPPTRGEQNDIFLYMQSKAPRKAELRYCFFFRTWLVIG
jgi:hypothetical protein